jgi:UDP-N-acetylmuramyl pentapeptide phosphotransferase/UDP-N-acetylglucosamine-1-phosphate transferase
MAASPTPQRLRLALLAALLLCLGLAITRPPKGWHPVMSFEAGGGDAAATQVALDMLFLPRASLRDCEALTGQVARLALAACRHCRLVRSDCSETVSAQEQAWLDSAPLDKPSGRLRGGVIQFRASDPALAQASCEAAEQLSVGGDNPVTCHPAGTPRPPVAPAHPADPVGLLLFLAAFAAAALTGWAIVRYEHLHAHLSMDGVDSGPQKFHTQPTPRIGGVAIATGLALSALLMAMAQGGLAPSFGALLLAGLPAFVGGLTEDLTKRVGVLERLLLTMLAGALAAWLLGGVLHRLDIPGVDDLLHWLPVAAVFTAFAVGGIANAINIIDGYNGLAAGFALIVLGAMAVVANLVGDALVLSACLALAGALTGFLIWNWPRGRIFMGDGGAYLLGFLLAELSVLLVMRNPGVSPWFPLLLLTHPVMETLYSVFRRRVQQGLSPGEPDNRHFHQMVHVWLRTRHQQSGQPASPTALNSATAKYILLPAILLAMSGAIWYQDSLVLQLAVLLYCLAYIGVYRQLARYRNSQARDHSPGNTQRPS